MFKFLKDKLKKAVGKFSKEVEVIDESVEKIEKKEIVEEKPVVEQKTEILDIAEPEKKKEEPKIEKEIEEVEKQVPKKQEVKEDKPEEKPEIKPEKEEAKQEEKKAEPEKPKKGLFGLKDRLFGKVSDIVTKSSISESRFNELFDDIELALLENNVALEVIDKVKQDLKTRLVDQKFDRKQISTLILDSLKETFSNILNFNKIDIVNQAKEKKPYVIAFFGVNGAGKTTNLVKIAKFLENNNLTCVIAACDTFRAAAIQQLEEHAKNISVKVIKHDYGSDAAAVAFDAIEHAKAKNKDVVLIDTAGRQHSNVNLMDELKKVVRVSNPDLKIFVGESITGNDCIDQAHNFNKSVDIDAIVLTKADVDEKGGAAISISYVIKKPILFFGTGQDYGDLKEFNKDFIMDNLGLI